jgi:hypothetical protein
MQSNASWGLPIWVTVLVGGVLGGFVVGLATIGLHGNSPLVSTFLPVLASGVAGGIAVHMLLPSMSGRAVGLGTAVTAGICGAFVGFIPTHIANHSHIGAGGLVEVIALVASIAVPTWMIGEAAS